MTNCTITLGLHRAVLEGDFPDEELDEAFALSVPNHYFMPLYNKRKKDGTRVWDGKKHFVSLQYSGKATMPTGLAWKVRRWLRENHVSCRIKDRRPRLSVRIPKHPTLSGVKTLWDHQIGAIRAGLTKQQGAFDVPTSGGKTFIMAALAKYILKGHPDRQILLITHTLTLQSQTRRVLKKRLPQYRIGKIGESEFEPGDVTVGMIQTLVGRWKDTEGGGREELRQFLEQQDAIFVDEGHHTPAKSWLALWNACHAPIRFVLSGSLETGVAIRDMTFLGATGRVLYRISSEQLEKKGHYIKPWYISLDDRALRLNPKLPHQVAYREGIVQSDVRNAAIGSLTELAVRLGMRVLILVKEIDHGESIITSLPESISAALVLGGKDRSRQRDEDLERFRKGKLSVLVATSTLDEGVDVPQLDVVILAGAYQSQTKFIQQAGRSTRPAPGKRDAYVIDFQDRHHPTLAKWSRARSRIAHRLGWSGWTIPVEEVSAVFARNRVGITPVRMSPVRMPPIQPVRK